MADSAKEIRAEIDDLRSRLADLHTDMERIEETIDGLEAKLREMPEEVDDTIPTCVSCGADLELTLATGYAWTEYMCFCGLKQEVVTPR